MGDRFGSLLLSHPTMAGAQQQELELPDFRGKVVVLYVSNAPVGVNGGVVLEYAEPRVVGGRVFVQGRVPEIDGAEWVSHLPAAVAWDAVIHYVIFDSVDDYAQRTAQAMPGFWARLFNRGAG